MRDLGKPEIKKAYLTREERNSKTVFRNTVIAVETPFAYLLQLDADREIPPQWFPKRYVKIRGTKSNSMSGYKVYMMEYAAWIFKQKFRNE